MKFYKTCSISLLLFSYLTPSQADIFDDFDQEIKAYKQAQADPSKEQQAYQQFSQNYLQEYNQWRSQYLSEFDQYQAAIIKKWGTADNSKNVQYSADTNVKSVINYETNQVTIEMLVDNNLSQAEAKKLLSKKISSLLADQSSNLASINAKGLSVSAKPLTISPVSYSKKEEQAAKQVILEQTIVYLQNVDKQADQILLTNNSISTEQLQSYVAKEKQKIKQEALARIAKIEAYYNELRNNTPSTTQSLKTVKYQINLPQNSLAERAKKYVPLAEKESQRFDIPAPLIMAIMHSESSFDPQAKSAVPAFGLMQIVPQTAGHDVNKLVRNIDSPMKASELYNPETNVETGSAYLSILDKRYLKLVTNPVSRLYCTIAAYNTGAGNIATVFNNKDEGNTRNFTKAAKIINKLSPQEVYDTLMKKLPYDETKHYLQKVSSRIALYQAKS